MISPQSNITALMKKLINKGFVSIIKSEADKREYVISITDEGLVLLKKLDAEIKPQMAELLKLSVSESFHLNSLLDKLRGD